MIPALGARTLDTSTAHSLLNALGRAAPWRVALMSSSAQERSYESEEFCGGHGAFSCALLDGLKGEADANGNRLVEVQELYEYVYGRVKTMTSKRQHPAISDGSYDAGLPLAFVASGLPERGPKAAAALDDGTAPPAAGGVPDVSAYEQLEREAKQSEEEKARTESAAKEQYIDALEKAWKSVQSVAARKAVSKEDRLQVVKKLDRKSVV